MRPVSRSRIAPFRARWGFLGALALLAVIGLAAAVLTPPAAPLTGRATAVDGDTLRMGSVRVRLLGIDAPELDQSCTDPNGRIWPCGTEARAFVAALLRGATLDCARFGRDIYGRTLARCSMGETDIARSIAAAGWALSNADYASAEAEAQAAKRGIWSGEVVPPADWRRSHGESEPSLWDWIRSLFA